ncbi:MAG TPA: B-box zinc finger protein [Terriglobales bacterium]|nr:B-box zinc finger protein [Terriglobales bacterium]
MTTTCANHTGVAASAFCRTCGKPLCESCKRDVRGVIYCEECIAARLSGTMPPDPAIAAGIPPRGLPNPTLAAFLGIIPGVGAFYNGQYQKGVVHFVILVGLGMLTDQWEGFGFAIPLFFGYMVWDAYKTARARITGEPVPDVFGINNLFGLENPATPGTPAKAQAPIGAIVLIGLGVLFLLGDINRYFVRQYWPIILIVLGMWKGAKRWQVE